MGGLSAAGAPAQRAADERQTPAMPRPSRLFSCTAAALLATGVAGAGFLLTGAGAHSDLTTQLTAASTSSWPPHVFAPYVDTGLSTTTLTTVAADSGTKYFEPAFHGGWGCQ